jgi:uncharacterized protein YbaR (Trm112 family)
MNKKENKKEKKENPLVCPLCKHKIKIEKKDDGVKEIKVKKCNICNEQYADKKEHNKTERHLLCVSAMSEIKELDKPKLNFLTNDIMPLVKNSNQENKI